jgi:hypothetical protein
LGDSKTEKQAVEVGFYGSARHLELLGDFGIVAAL